MSTVVSVPSEKGAATMKTDAAAPVEVEVVDERKALLIRRGLDVFFVVYLMFCVGVAVVTIMVSDKWWDAWPAAVILAPICIATLWLTPKMKDVYVLLYATKKIPESDNDLSTKLLDAEK